MDTEARDSNDRWMYLAGPLFLILVLVSFVVQGDIPEEKDAAADVVRQVADKDTRFFASVLVLTPAIVMLLVFVSRFRAAVDDRARAPRALMVAGAAVFAAGVAVSSSVTLALVVAAKEGMAAPAQTLNVLNASLWIPVVIGAAALLIGAGLSVLRTRILPTWLGWVALVVGVVSMFGPGGFAGFLVTPLWVAAAGVMLYLRKPVTAPA